MKEWQFNVLFFVGVAGAVAMLFGSELGIDITKNPTAVTGVGAILTYVLTQKKAIVKSHPPPEEPKKNTTTQQEEEDGV